MIKLLIQVLCFILLSYRGVAQSSELLSELIEKAEQTNTEALIVYRNDELIVENYFEIGHPDTLIETMSCTKSIVALAMMAMLDDGLLDSLETPVYHFYPEWNQGMKKQITIFHLLSMTSGIQNVPNASIEIYPSPDFVKLALCAELSDPPGAKFSYNNKSLNLLAGIVHKLTGKRLDEYVESRLFRPLGIERYKWTLDEVGNPHVMAGCQLRPMDFAKIGLMVLNQGRHNGGQVITAPSITSMLEPTQLYQGYGLLWWISYEETYYVVDNEVIEQLESMMVSEEFIQSIKSIKGTYKGFDVFEEQLQQEFGEDYSERIYAETKGEVQIRKKVFIGEPISYNANGYLGNYLVIVPETRTVGVRMTSHRSYDWESHISNSYTEFIDLIIGL